MIATASSSSLSNLLYYNDEVGVHEDEQDKYSKECMWWWWRWVDLGESVGSAADINRPLVSHTLSCFGFVHNLNFVFLFPPISICGS